MPPRIVPSALKPLSFATLARVLLALLLVVMLAPWPAQATPILLALGGVTYAPDAVTQSTGVDYSCVGMAGCTGSYSGVNATVNYAGGSAYSTATFGVLKGYSSASSARSESESSQSQTLMYDDLTITSSNVQNGSTGLLNFGLLLDAGLGVTTAPPSSRGEAYWQLSVPGATGHSGTYNVSDDGHGPVTTLQGDVYGGQYQESLAFTFGTPFVLGLVLTTDCLSVSGPGCSADLFHTLYWDGISSIATGGSTVTDFNLVSGSGTNWQNSFAPQTAVPEADTLLLLALGLMATRNRHLRRALVTEGCPPHRAASVVLNNRSQ
jgi:hypothetical protein